MTFHNATVTDEENLPRVPKVATIELHELAPTVPGHVTTLELGRIIYDSDPDLGIEEMTQNFYNEVADALEDLARSWRELANNG